MSQDLIDTRTISRKVYNSLSEARKPHEGKTTHLKEQYNQAVELYTYIATWGLLRLKAEEKALSQEGKREVVVGYFEVLQNISNVKNLKGNDGLNTLLGLETEDYLGLTGLGLQIAREYGFWAESIYADVKEDAKKKPANS